MKTIMLSALLSAALCEAALAERLDRRFGDDRQRGYRAEREFEGRDTGFRNRDRANFLGSNEADRSRPELPKQELQAPAAIGLQR